VILECCVCSEATALDQLFTWTRTMQAMEKWPFRVRVRYYSWLRSHEKAKIEKYEDPTTGLLVNSLCKEHTKQVIGEAGLLVSWNGLDALVQTNAKRDKYGPTFHVGPYMLQSRIYQRKWTVCSQGHPNTLVRMPYDYEAAYGWFDPVWESTKRPPTEASDTERYLCERLRSQSNWEKLSCAGQVRMHLVLGKEPPKFPSRQESWRITVVGAASSKLSGYGYFSEVKGIGFAADRLIGAIRETIPAAKMREYGRIDGDTGQRQSNRAEV
jgi:molybdopterin converting factor small subunit